MKRGGQVGAELHGQCDRDFSGQVGGIIQVISGHQIKWVLKYKRNFYQLFNLSEDPCTLEPVEQVQEFLLIRQCFNLV